MVEQEARQRMTEIRYADTVGWEAWQAKYRYGAFYLFPPVGVIEPLDALRRTYDAQSAAICQAHISLSEPLAGPLADDGIDEIRTALARCAPFDIRYGPLRSFPPHPGVVYAIQPEDSIMRLRAVLHATSLFAGRSLVRAQIAPHLTIAEFISLERTDELLRALSGKVPEGTFRCTAVDYAVPNQHFSFERVLALPLGQEDADR